MLNTDKPIVIDNVALVYDSLPPPVRKAIGTAVTRIAISVAGGFLRFWWARVIGSKDERAVRDALSAAVVASVGGHSDLQSIGLAKALSRQPFAGLITRVLQNPHDEIDEQEVRRTFTESIYDLGPIGIDEVQLVQDIRARFLNALLSGSSLEAKLMFTATRAEQVHAGQARMEMGQQRLAAGIGILLERVPGSVRLADDKDEEGPWNLRLEEANALYRSGNVRSALRIWERLRDDIAAETANPILRARIYNNIGAALLELGQPEQAVTSFRKAVDHAPDRSDFLANLAQGQLIIGQSANAVRDAQRVIAASPESLTAWSVLIQAGTVLSEDDLPATLRGEPQLLMARAMAAAGTDRSAAIALMREALQAGKRDPQVLILLAELLYTSLFPRRLSTLVPTATLDEISRLGREAAALLENTERKRLRARALLIQGAAADLAGEDDRGSAYFEQAVEVDHSNDRAVFGAVQAQLNLGNGAAALYLLDGQDSQRRSASWHALRARALVVANRSEELAEDVDSAVSKSVSEPNYAILPFLGETIVRAQRADLLEPVAELLLGTEQEAFAHLFRARAAVQGGDRSAAEREYAAAREFMAPANRPEIDLELASYMYREEDYQEAVRLYEASNVWFGHERAEREFAHALAKLRRWSEVMDLIARLGERAELSDWALDLQAQIAWERNDPKSALIALQLLVERHPDDARSRILLAHTLVRMGEVVRADETVATLAERDDLGPEETADLARVLIQVRRPVPALLQAYRALRENADDPDIQYTCIVDVFYRAAGARAAPAELFVRAEVATDTWFKLRAEDGEELEYLILSRGPVDVRRNELLESDPRVQEFLGLKEQDAIRLPPSATNEKEFRVVELKSALLHTFHEAMLTYQTRFPGRLDMQMVHVGEGDAFDPWPVYKMMLQSKETSRSLVDLYKAHRAPLGALASAQGQSIRRTYLQLLYDPDVPIYVEHPGPEGLSQSLAEARSEGVVLTATGLTTLQVLGALHLPRELYQRLMAPQSLLDELDAEIGHWDEAKAHGGYHTGEVTDTHTFSFQAVGLDDIERARARVVEFRSALIEMAEILPRPLDALSAEETRKDLGASSYDSYALAKDHANLHVDDWGLRNLAQSEAGVGGFSTFALLRVAEERGVITSEELRRYTVRLIGFRHTFIPIDAALVYESLAERRFQVDEAVLALVDVLSDPSTSIESAVAVAARLLRELALSPLGKGMLAEMTTLLLERLCASRAAGDVVQLFIAELGPAFRLLPLAESIIRDRLTGFIAAKSISQT